MSSDDSGRLLLARPAGPCYIQFDGRSKIGGEMETARPRPARRARPGSKDRLEAHHFTIHPRHMALLKERAAARGVPVSLILREVLDEWVDLEDSRSTPKPGTGAELVAELTENGLIGMWADRTDIKDSVEFARRLRERAQTRADRNDAEEIERLGGAHPAGSVGG
jgi:hypothetical protein